MTKQLREWTAPEEQGGLTYRWNPRVNYVQRKVGDSWVCVLDTAELLNHAAALNALRADPYVAPKGLRGQVADALSNAYEAGRYGLGAPGWSGVSTIADAIMDVIDRERPALGEVSDDVLVGELERRGWKESKQQLEWSLYNPTRMHRVLITPERAG